MAKENKYIIEDADPRFNVFFELMQKKVKNILLVSSLYDFCIMEEDGRLAERINNEYRGLNLSQPPRLTWVPSAEEALAALDQKNFDLVITMQRLADMDAASLGWEIKKRAPDLPVILLTHEALIPECPSLMPEKKAIDRIFVWTGNTDLLLAMIKSMEDRMNVEHDTEMSGVRVILVVEDSPLYLSIILPIIYHEVVAQTQAVLEEKINEEHRLLTMRARAKILVAENFEDAVEIFETYKNYLVGVISDVRFPMGNKLDPNAGLELFTRIKSRILDLPYLLTSSEPANRQKAEMVRANFLDKNSNSLHEEIKTFFLDHLGFGDFVFRRPDRSEVFRVSSVRALEKFLAVVPRDSLIFHAARNDFSRWLFARAETLLALKLRPASVMDFVDSEDIRAFLIDALRTRRKNRQKGVVADFESLDFDPETEFLKIGTGSLGGKARGLVFIFALLRLYPWLARKYPEVDFRIPHTLVITTQGFDDFIESNGLAGLSKQDLPDDEISDRFLAGRLPEWLTAKLSAFLEQVNYPLAIRSSGLLEDAQFQAYAGLYRTYMVPNDADDPGDRLEHLVSAIKLVYASTFFQGPKAFARRVGHRTEDEKMAVIIQELIGHQYGDYFYPTISGVAQSHNFYPISRMKPEDGIAAVALGLGKTVVGGGKALRFSPKHPQLLPQFSTVEDILKNAQRFFYALEMGGPTKKLDSSEEASLAKREVIEAIVERPVQLLASTYLPEEHRIKDVSFGQGHLIITFAQILKYKTFPLSEVLTDLIELLYEGMGCPVELEFSIDIKKEGEGQADFALLQVRPMSARAGLTEVAITDEEIDKAFCYSTAALGNTSRADMLDIIMVKPDVFDPSRTVEIAGQIGQLNGAMLKEQRPYLLVGPGRWGSADRWLGIPVSWTDISGVGAIVETTLPQLKAEPSQGSHFFHNVTTLGINYLTVAERDGNFIDWEWLSSQPVNQETKFVAHLRLDNPFVLKVDGRKSMGVIFESREVILDPIMRTPVC